MFKKKKPRKISDKVVEVKRKNKPEKPVSHGLKNTLGVLGFLALVIVITIVVKESLPRTKSYDEYSYNGFAFTGNGVLWATTIYDSLSDTDYNIQLHNGPREVEDIPVEGDVALLRDRATGFFITFDPTTGNETMGYIALSAYEISSNFNTVYKKPVIAACDREYSPDCDGRDIVDCTDPNIPAIYLKEGSPTKVYVEDACIIVQGEGEEIVKASNRLLYEWYGIIK